MLGSKGGGWRGSRAGRGEEGRDAWGARLHGTEAATIKFHMLLHFGTWLDSFLPTCWALERKHKVAKRWITPTTNTSVAFDRAAFRDTLNQHLHQSSEFPDAVVGLEQPVSSAPPEVLAALTRDGLVFGSVSASRTARANEFETIRAGDMVEGTNGSTAFVGRVLLHLEFDGKGLATLLETFVCVISYADRTVWDRRQLSHTMVRLQDISTACIYCETPELFTVLRSPRARR